MRTWILLSTFALALPLAACGDDTGGTGGAGGGGGGDAASTSSNGTTTDASSGSGATADFEVISPCTDDISPRIENTNSGSTAFSQPDVTIAVGEVVRFAPSGPHDMTSTDLGDDGLPLWETPTSAEACIRFNVAGTFAYECSVHPAMVGTVTVE